MIIELLLELRSLHVAYRKLFSSWLCEKGGEDQAGQKKKQKQRSFELWREFVSKLTKVNRNMETFTSTEYTTTVVIYRYSSPSSFQLFENKKSRRRSSNTALTEQVNIVAVFLFTEVYIHTGAICSIRVTLRRSKTRLWLLTRPLTVGLTTHMHADTHIHTHVQLSPFWWG